MEYSFLFSGFLVSACAVPVGWFGFFFSEFLIPSPPLYEFADSPELPPIDGSDPYRLALFRNSGLKGAIDLAIWSLFRRKIVSLDDTGMQVLKPEAKLHHRYERAALAWAKSMIGKTPNRESYHTDPPFMPLWIEKNPSEQYADITLKVPFEAVRYYHRQADIIAVFYCSMAALALMSALEPGLDAWKSLLLMGVHLVAWYWHRNFALQLVRRTASMRSAMSDKIYNTYSPLLYKIKELPGWYPRTELTWPELLLLSAACGIRHTRGIKIVPGPHPVVPELATGVSGLVDSQKGGIEDKGAPDAPFDVAPDATFDAALDVAALASDGGASDLLMSIEEAESTESSDRDGGFFDSPGEDVAAQSWSDGGYGAGFESGGWGWDGGGGDGGGWDGGGGDGGGWDGGGGDGGGGDGGGGDGGGG